MLRDVNFFYIIRVYFNHHQISASNPNHSELVIILEDSHGKLCLFGCILTSDIYFEVKCIGTMRSVVRFSSSKLVYPYNPKSKPHWRSKR